MAIDGDPATCWTSGDRQQGGEFFHLELGWETRIRKIVLDSTSNPGEYPRGFFLLVQEENGDMEFLASDQGNGDVVEIEFPPRRMKRVSIYQTGNSGSEPWSIGEITYEAEYLSPPANLEIK